LLSWLSLGCHHLGIETVNKLGQPCYMLVQHCGRVVQPCSYKVTYYCIAQNSDREKLWQISYFKVLVRKTLVNAQYLYYWQEKNFGESEGELSFVNLPKWLVFNDALTHN